MSNNKRYRRKKGYKKNRRQKNTAEVALDANGKPIAKDEKGKGLPPKTNVFMDYAKSIGIALVIALMLRQFIFQAFRIPTGSMLETLQIGDYLFVNKFLYGAKTPERIRILNWTLADGLPVLQLP